MFTVEERDRARAWLLDLADRDPQVVAGAEVGSAAEGGGDRWSDLDLTFGVEGAGAVEVADEWAAAVADGLGGTALFDVWAGAALYRVFLLPGCLQVDLSFAPAAEWGARGPRFRLLFGEEGEPPASGAEPDVEEHFGVAVHHAVRARVAIERGLLWQAEHWIGDVRGHAFELACSERGLPRYGRGIDRLPAELLDEGMLVRSLDRDELLRALAAAVDLLRRAAGARAEPLEERFRELVA